MKFSSGKTERIVTFVIGLVHEGKKNSVCYVHGLGSEVYADAGVLIRHTLYAAVVGTVRPLLGSRRNGQATLHLSQKRLPYWKYVVYRSAMLGNLIYLLSFPLLFVRIF